jgi:hypothetical protein
MLKQEHKLMPLQFTSNRRTVFKRKRVNHRTPTTIREKMIAGLQSMGFEKIQARTSKYEVFWGGDKNWYVGANGALRIGRNTINSLAASLAIKELVLTAPTVRPLVRSWLDANQKDIIPAEGHGILVEKVLQAHPELTEISPRIVASHIKTWLKEEGYLVNGLEQRK